MAKIHLAVQYLPNDNPVPSHFKTSCGITRHIFTNVDSTQIISKVTCKNCLKAFNPTPR